MTKEMLHQLVEETCLRMFGCELREATEKQAYRALCVTVRMMLEDKQRAFQAETKEKERKQVYYMSMEFLVGTSLRNNLFNLGLYSEADEVLKELGFSLPKLCEMEPDAGLGNGGLGRLASCYMDAATGLEYSAFSSRRSSTAGRSSSRTTGWDWAMCGCTREKMTRSRCASAERCMSGWTTASSRPRRWAISR